MDPGAPPPPPPPGAASQPPLPAGCGQRLYNAIAAMSANSWLDPAQLEDILSRAGQLLCALHPGCASLGAYVQAAAGGSGGGGPCTHVWTAGTIAYRCRTCGLSPSAAVCVDCFRASDHEGHDYTMYTSDAGGCCDCGDLSSWRPSGCCPRHRPAGGEHGADEPPPLPPADDVVLRGVVGCALARLQLALEACLAHGPPPPGQPTREQQSAAALRLMGWLVQLGQAPSLRRVLCEEVLQPAAASAAVQAASLAAAAGAPPEAAAVARMLQQQREQLLRALEGVLPLPGGDAEVAHPGAAQRPLPLLGPAPHQHSLLYWQMASLLPLDAGLVEELASLQILLLYSLPYKEAFGRLLLAFYPHFGALGKRHAVTKALDRLTVQVFHLEETTLALAQRDGLLEVLLGSLLATLRHAVGANHLLNGDSPVLTGRNYLRIAADLHMCLSHPAVALLLLTPGVPQAALFTSHFLKVFRLIEGASPFKRKLGDHVLYESEAWVNCVQLEVHMMHMLKQGLLHTLLKAAEAGAMPADTAALALAFGLSQTWVAVQAAAGPLQAADDPHSFWANTLSGRGSISAHIPLERLAAAFLGGLLHLGATSPDPGPYLAAAALSLGEGLGPSEEGQSQAAEAARCWEMCGLAAERVTAWMSQIRQRMWVRNGQQLLRLEAFYSSPYWSDHGLDADLLAMQSWLASTPSLSRALGFLTFDSSAVQLLRVSGAPTLAEACRLLAEARASQDLLRCSADWLRLLVVLLRERSVWHPTYSPLPLRRAVVHILAAGARSHSEVAEELPYELAHCEQLEQVLAEVADYQPPTAASTGRYSLKKACWREFDPFYPHFTRRDLQSALHAAQESGAWQPEWQLQAGLPPLPAPLAGLQRMLHHLLRIVWAALLTACAGGGGPAGAPGAGGGGGSDGGGGGTAEDCALAATHLLCLGLQRKHADLEALVAGTTVPGAPPLPESWRAAAGFRAKCEEHLAGAAPARPGIIYLLRVLAGAEPWVDGSRREASWELKRCASEAAKQAQALLSAARQAAPGEQPAAAEQLAAAEGVVAGQAAPEAAAAAGEAAAGEGQQQQPEGDAAARKKAQAKQRQAQMLARMRAQQAKAAAALLEEPAEQEEEGPTAAAEGGAAAMEVDAAGATAAAAAPLALPAHHPAAWERLGAECALCHSGSEAGALGLVAQLQVTQLPALAAVDPPAPLTPEHPGLCGGALGAPDPDAADPEEARQPFPLPGMGPRLSMFDRQPGMHVLCCGHMLHAACLERYRASWRQRIASGQFVEGYQLLQPSQAAGEYLCPICRRLGNSLLPAVAEAPEERQQQQAQEQPAQQLPLSSQEAAQRLQRLLAPCSDNWATAPATADAQLQQRWQQHAGAGLGPDAPARLPEDVALLPAYGSQEAGVRALCAATRQLGSKWLAQQQRVLEWLQRHAAAHPDPPLWGIAVTPVAGEPEAQPQQPQTLQAALQQLLDQAAEAGGDMDAIGAFAQAAAAVAAMEEVALEGGEGEEGEEEGSGSEVEEEGPGGPGLVGAGPALLEGLQHVAEAIGPAAPAAATGAGAPAAASVAEQHQHSLMGSGPADVLWSLLGSGIVQWEAAHRDPAGAPSSEVDAAHWRALRSLAHLAAASQPAGSGTGSAALLAQLQQLAAGGVASLITVEQSGAVCLAATLLPNLQQLPLAPAAGPYELSYAEQDPFALLLHLLAALLARPGSPEAAEPQGLSRSVHRQPAEVLRALLALLYPVAAGQAVALATGGAHSGAEIAAALDASLQLAAALEGAASSQLLPWLQRAALLLALLSGAPVPAPPAAASGPAVPGAAVLLAQLGLPALSDALRSPAASSLAPPSGAPSLLPPSSMQLSVRVGQEQWTATSPPLPAAAKLLQLPASYQSWYLSLGSRQCSACGQVPAEPALCLRCGAVVCCNGRRCQGAQRQGMCYTHSWACGGGSGAFLLTKMTRLLLIRKNRATFLASPYVDAHGEEDLRLQRGKPLSLHAERLRHLVQLWRSSALDFDSQVLHAANHRNEFASMY